MSDHATYSDILTDYSEVHRTGPYTAHECLVYSLYNAYIEERVAIDLKTDVLQDFLAMDVQEFYHSQGALHLFNEYR
jgi:hypothetical protein